MKNTFLTVFICLIVSATSIGLYDYFRPPVKEVITIREMTPPATYTSFASPSFVNSTSKKAILVENFTAAAATSTPTVVNIKALQKGKGSFEDFWSSAGVSSGSGVIISSDGYIVTNQHVIEDAADIEVTLNDKRTFNAVVVGEDASTDLALIKISGSEKFQAVHFADSDTVEVGEWVLAVGNPFNLTSTVTAGIVSAKGRNINILEGAYKIESFIQTDAAVNPGNSGGALVNTKGQLIGINTAIITQSGRYEGYSFAVPANLVRKVVEDLKEFGMVQRGFLGVVIRDVNEEIAQDLKLDNIAGVYVSEVNEGSAAAESGLLPDDVITHINEVPVLSMPELQEQVARYRPGDNISVTYIRKGKPDNLRLTLKNKRNDTKLAVKDDVELLDNLGFELRELTTDESSKVNSKGVKVISIRKGSKIDRTNMDPDFIITKINDVKVEDVAAVIREIEKASKRVMLEGVYEDMPGDYYYAFMK